MKKSPELIIGTAASAMVLVLTVIAIIIASVRGRFNDYYKHIELAQHFLSESQYDKAIAEYEAAIAIEPNNAEAYPALARVYIELENYEAANKILRQSAERADAEEVTVYQEIGQEDDQVAQNGNKPQESVRITDRESADKHIQGGSNGSRKEIYYRDDGSYSIYEYDTNGNRVKSTYYLEDGTVVDFWVYEYDDNGNLIKEAYYFENGTSVEYWIYEYDENGNRIQMTYYNADGTIGYYSVYEYDENGNRVKATGYSADGSIISIDEYDENGNKIKTTWYNPDGTIDTDHVYDNDTPGEE